MNAYAEARSTLAEWELEDPDAETIMLVSSGDKEMRIMRAGIKGSEDDSVDILDAAIDVIEDGRFEVEAGVLQ